MFAIRAIAFGTQKDTNLLPAFRCGAEDAEVMARELCMGDVDRLTVTAADIVGLADYACFVRVRDGVPRVFGVETRRVSAL